MTSSFRWERTVKQTTHYILVDHLQVIVGSHQGSGQSDHASGCPYAEFLEGRFQKEILRNFEQNILDEIIAAVRNAKNNPNFIAKHRANQNRLDILNTIPLDATLAEIIKDPNIEKGASNYGNAGGYKTTLKSNTLTITFERDKGFIVPNAGGEKINFTLPAHGSRAVALNDHFYIIANDDFVIATPSGEILKEKNTIFGGTIRITTVNRYEKIVFFSYRWFQNEYPRGWLKHELGKGFTGRWIETK